TLAGLGFDVCGWSASGRGPEGMRVYAGPDLEPALSRADILVTLLPDTAETRGLLNAKRLAMLPRGAAIINPGRGTLIDDEALLAALDEGRVSRAALDVFHTEPLPPNHPFWHHERIHVTPHIAAATRPETAALLVAENLRRAASGREPLYLVDRARGY
ncbi:MAG: NAD(P)-dependent oxidoreductase, partial [Paracoccus sp. (in: a-proteobacteria)]|nr:NAD(P)-dependent oxidoreductase [Paracoccus sp. (in: a-proteobacteria)]